MKRRNEPRKVHSLKNFEPFQLAVVLTKTNWQGICTRHENTTDRACTQQCFSAGRMQRPPPSNLHTISTRSGVNKFRSTINLGGGGGGCRSSSRSRRPVLTFLQFTHPPRFSDWREGEKREREGRREGGRRRRLQNHPARLLLLLFGQGQTTRHGRERSSPAECSPRLRN